MRLFRRSEVAGDADVADATADVDPDAAGVADAADDVDPAVQGWRRVVRGNRVLWVLAAVAVISLVAGVGLSFVIVSPGQAAAERGEGRRAARS